MTAHPSQRATYPGGSRQRVNHAGARVREGTVTLEDLDVIETWRSAHRVALKAFHGLLRGLTQEQEVSVAQRHKRKRTIFDKLRRYPGMKLSRMDDVAGCRLIFANLEELHAFRAAFHGVESGHRRKNDADKYDYIQRPKASGYRGIHDVYVCESDGAGGEAIAGLNMEIQYRTLVQHAWSTAVELVGFVAKSQPKFQRGDRRYHEAMALASEVMARAFEDAHGPHPDLPERVLVERFLDLDQELGLLNKLRALDAAGSVALGNRHAILISNESGRPDIHTYTDAADALQALFRLEDRFPEKDIVLVRADTAAEVRLAFRNYFADAHDFIELVELGCARLLGEHIPRRVPA